MDINKKFKGHKIEDIDLLHKIEEILISKRGYAFKMPPPGSTVISLMSGGLDTTVVTAMLLDKFKLQVYPVHFHRTMPASNPLSVFKSVQFFWNLFRKRYGKRCHELVTLPLQFPNKHLEEKILEEGQVILNSRTGQRRGIPFQPSAFAHETINYLYTLPKKDQRKIKNIFTATVRSNTNWYSYETLTAYRALTLEVCTMLKDFSWQITALPIEKNLEFYMDKEDLIQEGISLNLPLEYTFTCQQDLRYQCGVCIVCLFRRGAFYRAKVPDKTIYESDRKDIMGNIKRMNPLFKNLFKRL